MTCLRVASILLTLVITGCAVRSEFIPPSPDEDKYAPPTLDYSLPKAQHGSLYRHNYGMTLFQDRRAYRVGDMLTVMLAAPRASSASLPV